jgi:hypothetical protein
MTGPVLCNERQPLYSNRHPVLQLSNCFFRFCANLPEFFIEIQWVLANRNYLYALKCSKWLQRAPSGSKPRFETCAASTVVGCGESGDRARSRQCIFIWYSLYNCGGGYCQADDKIKEGSCRGKSKGRSANWSGTTLVR